MQHFEDNILAYLENALPETDKIAFEQELAQNELLQRALKDMQRTKKFLLEHKQNLQLAAEIDRRTPELKAELSETLEKRNKQVGREKAMNNAPIIPLSTAKFGNSRRMFLTVAASILMVIGLGWWVTEQNGNRDTPLVAANYPDFKPKGKLMGKEDTKNTSFNRLSNAYFLALRYGKYTKFDSLLQKFEPKDTTQHYEKYSMQATIRYKQEKYEEALFALKEAEQYAVQEPEKIEVATNQIFLLFFKLNRKHEANTRMKKLEVELPNATEDPKVKDLKAHIK